MAPGVRQQLPTREVRPEQCVALRFGEWDEKGHRCSVLCTYAHGALASFAACSIMLMNQFSPTTPRGWNDLQNSQPVQHQKGEKVLAIIENNGYVLAPLPVASVNETDMVLLPQGLQALKQVAKQVGLELRDAYLNLDGGFDSAHNRKCIFNAGLIPNITENPRNRKTTKRGRKRFFNEAMHALRMRVERTFAWEDKFKRLLLRFERIQQRHYGMKLLAYTLMNLRAFCGT